MADYQEMYLALFRAVTKAVAVLQQAQRETEEMYISTDDPAVIVLPKIDTDSCDDVL